MKDRSNYFIPSNIRHIRKLLGHTQASFGEEIGASRAQIGSYEEGRATPPIAVWSSIQKLTGFSLDELIHHDLRIKDEDDFHKSSEVSSSFEGKSIPLIPQKAAAGYLQGYADGDYLEQLPQISFPFLQGGNYLAFEIEGDSMLPLPSGTIIIAEKIEKINDIKDGQSYIVAHEEGLVYKRVHFSGQIGINPELILRSDNPSYQPIHLPLKDVKELWKAVMFVSSDFPQPIA